MAARKEHLSQVYSSCFTGFRLIPASKRNVSLKTGFKPYILDTMTLNALVCNLYFMDYGSRLLKQSQDARISMRQTVSVHKDLKRA